MRESVTLQKAAKRRTSPKRCPRVAAVVVDWAVAKRHTFASHLVMKGVPLIQVKEWLGHGSITMTMRYAHLAPRAGASMIDMLEEPVAQAAN